MSTTNPAIHQERRKLLIDATITAVAEYGLSKVTLAKISSIAGLTAGTVNFHFDSKEALLLDTLRFVSEEFDRSIADALKKAGTDPSITETLKKKFCRGSLSHFITLVVIPQGELFSLPCRT